MNTKSIEIFPAGNSTKKEAYADLIPPRALRMARLNGQKAFPEIAKDPALTEEIEIAVRLIPTEHELVCGDSRNINDIGEESVHLAVTSPVYWTLKKYPGAEGQLALVVDYEGFLNELDKVWENVFKVLTPGGRLIIVVGDVCVPRKRFGRHVVFPLHASIQDRCRSIGFDNLTPIIWHKIANAQFEVEGSGGFLGKPYEPNAIIKNDVEYILFQRKPGGYRRPSLEARVLSVIPEARHREWFQQIWTMSGASTTYHPAPYPLALAERLIRMFSFVGDKVLDPFMGKGTTNVAASLWGRNSIGYDIEPKFFEMAQKALIKRADESTGLLFSKI